MRSIATVLLAAVFAGAPAARAERPPNGTPDVPVMRTVEYIYNRVATTPGPYRAAGYRAFVHGLETVDLFDLKPPTNPLSAALSALPPDLSRPFTYASEVNARLTHTETGCLIDSIPSVPSLLDANGLVIKEPSLLTVRAKARQCLYYDAHPSPRDFKKPETFRTGEVAAVMDLVVETDSIDLATQVGSGTAYVEVRCASPVALVGRAAPLDLAVLGSAFVADFQFQIIPRVPPVGSAGYENLVFVIPDSGVWRAKSFDEVPVCEASIADSCKAPLSPCP